MADKKSVLLYYHAGSMNHGCEAIVNGTMNMLMEDGRVTTPVTIVTNKAEEDRHYSLGELESEGKCRLIDELHMEKHFFSHVMYYIYRKVTKDYESFLRFRYKKVLKLLDKSTDKPVAVSIGGDNYCYPEMISDLMLTNDVFQHKGLDTVLMGCSIEPEFMAKDKKLVEDLKSYKKVIARESITYNALLKAGLTNDQVVLASDPAFRLEKVELPLPKGFKEGQTVGLNVSPMVQGKESVPGITMDNYRELIKHIINDTDYQVALIPHVVWASNDDREPLNVLYNEFKDTGRVIIINDGSASELKGFISKCAVFVGARTHSTIAAYSSCVPTLVLGYSVKSRGIATDIFGSYDNNVIPVQDLKKAGDLVAAFDWINDRRDDIKSHLEQVMPGYIDNAKRNIEFMNL